MSQLQTITTPQGSIRVEVFLSACKQHLIYVVAIVVSTYAYLVSVAALFIRIEKHREVSQVRRRPASGSTSPPASRSRSLSRSTSLASLESKASSTHDNLSLSGSSLSDADDRQNLRIEEFPAAILVAQSPQDLPVLQHTLRFKVAPPRQKSTLGQKMNLPKCPKQGRRNKSLGTAEKAAGEVATPSLSRSSTFHLFKRQNSLIGTAASNSDR